jgi:hypothetical protein
MSSIARVILLLFFPAWLGLLRQVFGADSLADQVLAIAILLLCIDQARMAVVDLEQLAQVKQQTQDRRLRRFSQATVSTIILELLGFYIAGIWLGSGAIAVLLSLIWFNLLAGIQLHPEQTVTIRPWGIPERLPVLLADGIGLVLISLWMVRIAPLAIASGLLGLVTVYGGAKYGLPSKFVGKSRQPDPSLETSLKEHCATLEVLARDKY